MRYIARLGNLRKDRSASSFIETAIMLPLILLMCCGTMDFARVVHAGTAIANAARAGVQYGALTPGHSGDTAGMRQAALDDAADLGPSNITATARNFCGCAGSADEISCTGTTCSGATPRGYVAVTATYTFNTLVNWPGVPSSIVVTRTARMRAQ